MHVGPFSKKVWIVPSPDAQLISVRRHSCIRVECGREAGTVEPLGIKNLQANGFNFARRGSSLSKVDNLFFRPGRLWRIPKMASNYTVRKIWSSRDAVYALWPDFHTGSESKLIDSVLSQHYSVLRTYLVWTFIMLFLWLFVDMSRIHLSTYRVLFSNNVKTPSMMIFDKYQGICLS